MERDIPFYNARIKYYPNGTQKITVFSRGVFNPEGWERIRLTEKEKERREYNLTNPRDDNIKAMRDRIFDIAFMNEWEYFVTLTLDPEKIDRYDPEVVGHKVGTWLQNNVYRKGLKYLLVPEYHKDGAIHFHGLFSGNLTYLDSGRVDRKGRTIFNIKDWSFGFSDAVRLDNNRVRVSRYITKYITKDSRKIMGKFYLSSRNLIREVPSDFAHVCYDDVEGSEYSVPEAGMKVKYVVIGDL